MIDEARAPVFDIKRFALHDGPGIRSTGFIKGCPLSCTWCQNPEGIDSKPHLWYAEAQCIRCGKCLDSCPEDALTGIEGASRFVSIDRDRCKRCGECVEVCPTGALRLDSRILSAAELAEELMRDAVFYQSSEGGVTLSGGEPMYRPKYAVEVLRICCEKGFHTAVETTLYASESVVNQFIEVTDLFLVDVKLIDEQQHQKHTGVGNSIILENLRKLARTDADLLVRTPLIPGITDTEENISGVAQFVASLNGDRALELLNFNPLAQSKYRSLDCAYQFSDVLAPLSKERVERLKELARQNGCRVV